MKAYCVVTTINQPSIAIEKLHYIFGKNLLIVGDVKTPVDWNYKDAQYILDLPKEKEWYEGYAPKNHYARKNLGYLAAMKNKAEVIYDTDDDNIPNDKWKIRLFQTEANESEGEGWFNVYKVFSDKFIWPRGFSLREVNKNNEVGHIKIVQSSIQQGLSDGEPDVDAIFRLLYKSKNIFNVKASIFLLRNTWCPFNSQATFWFPKAYPLMYLPIYASFRMTDIWRSFVAQRCLWEIDEGVTFHSPSEVFQDRNKHDLLKDFEDEVPGYLKNDKIVEILSSLKLKQGVENICDNLFECYAAIVSEGILPQMEMRSLNAWIKDYGNITANL